MKVRESDKDGVSHSTSRHDAQLLEIERRLDALELELPKQTKKQQNSHAELEADAKRLLDRLNAVDTKVSSAQDDIAREAALTADWHSIHATKLAAHETALGELRSSLRHGQVRKRYLLGHFLYKNDQSTKTGSGQIFKHRESTQKRVPFSCRALHRTTRGDSRCEKPLLFFAKDAVFL